jgi:hypothetical protein
MWLEESSTHSVKSISSAYSTITSLPGYKEFGAVVREDAQKQRIGKIIRRVLEDEGFEWDRAGVPTPGNSLFTAPSVYRRKT